MNFFVIPDHAGLGDVAGLGRIEANQTANAFAVFGILAGRDVNSVFVKHRRRVDFAWAFGGGIFDRLAFFRLFVFGRIAIDPPIFLQEIDVIFFDRLRVERVTKSVAAAEENELLSVHVSGGRRTPLAVENSRADLRVIFARKFAGVLIERDEAGRIGRGNIGMRPVLAVGSAKCKPGHRQSARNSSKRCAGKRRVHPSCRIAK